MGLWRNYDVINKKKMKYLDSRFTCKAFFCKLTLLFLYFTAVFKLNIEILEEKKLKK